MDEPLWMTDDEQLAGTLLNESLHTGRNVMVRDDRDRKLLARAAERIAYFAGQVRNSAILGSES